MNSNCFLPLLLGAVLAAPAPAQALYGLFGLGSPDDGNRQLGTISATGTVSLLGTSTSMALGAIDTSSGHVAYDWHSGQVFCVGQTDDGVSRVFQVAIASGVTTNQALSQSSFNTITGVHWDRRSETLLAIVDLSNSDEQLATIDPATGTVTLIGAPITGAALATTSGVITGDDDIGRVFFTGIPAGGVATIYTVNTTTGGVTSAVLSGVAHNAICGLEWDHEEAVLYALTMAGTERQLASIDPTTGLVTAVGTTTIGGGGVDIATVQGATTLDAPRNRFLCVARTGGAWNLMEIDTATGAMTTVVVNETLIHSGGYVGLTYATGAESNFRNGSGVNAAEYYCETPPTLGATWHTKVETNPNTMGSYVCMGLDIPYVNPFLGFELLIDPGPGIMLLPTNNGVLDFPIPFNGGVGYSVRTQGLRVDNVNGSVQLFLLNAHELVVKS